MNDNHKHPTDNKPLGMKWFHFFYKIRCVFGILLSVPFTLVYYAMAEDNPLMYISAFLNIPLFVAYIIIVFNYFKNREIGYYPIIMYNSTMAVLVIEAISSLVAVNIFYLIFIGFNFFYFSKRKNVFYSNDTEIDLIKKEIQESPNIKLLNLCNSCKFNEDSFCQNNDCENCPNWKQNENDPNEYYCRCDEYEQSGVEECPYYVAEHESEAIEEEWIENIEEIENVEAVDNLEDIDTTDPTLSECINLLKTFLEETDPNDIFEPKKNDTLSCKTPSLDNYVNKEEILNTRCLDSEGLYADFENTLNKIFEDIKEDILSQDILSDNYNYEYSDALYALLFECLDFFVKVAKEEYDWIHDLPLVEMGIKGIFLEMTSKDFFADLFFMAIPIDDYLKIYYDTMTYVQNQVPLMIEDDGYISPEDETYESYELYLSLENFVCKIERNYLLRKNANVLVNNVVSTWEAYIDTAKKKDISTKKDFIISYPDKDDIEVYDEPSFDYVIIKTTEAMMINERGGSLYEATRRYWKISNRITQYKYIISVVDQIVQRVYLADSWYHYMPGEDGCPTTSDRWGFEGREIHGQEFEKLIGKRIPEKYRGQNPVQYKR